MRRLVWQQLHYVTVQTNYVLNTNDNVLARTGNIPVLPWHWFRGPWSLYTFKLDESHIVVSFFICPSWYIYAHITLWWGTLVNICVEEGNRIRTCALTWSVSYCEGTHCNQKEIPSSKQKTGAYILIDANMKLLEGWLCEVSSSSEGF